MSALRGTVRAGVHDRVELGVGERDDAQPVASGEEPALGELGDRPQLVAGDEPQRLDRRDGDPVPAWVGGIGARVDGLAGQPGRGGEGPEFSLDVTHGLKGDLGDALSGKPVQSGWNLGGVTGERGDGQRIAGHDLFVDVVEFGQVPRVQFQMAGVLGKRVASSRKRSALGNPSSRGSSCSRNA